MVGQGDLIPVSEESYNHGARVCKIGPDGKLYVSLGQPYSVSPQEKIALYDETGIGGILKMDTNGQNREVYVLGARNPAVWTSILLLVTYGGMTTKLMAWVIQFLQVRLICY